MQILRTILIWLAACLPLSGAEPTPAVGRVWIVDNGNVLAAASCVLVSRRPAIALTAAHVVDDMPAGSHISVHFAEQSPVAAYKATIAESRVEVDLAVLTFAGDPKTTPRPISWVPVKEGQRVWQSGWGGLKPQSKWGRVTNARIEMEDTDATYILATPLARIGDSGGPTLDDSGNVVGIISCVDTGKYKKGGRVFVVPLKKRRTYVVPLSENQWIKKHLARGKR